MILIGVFLFIGRQQQPPARLAILHLTDCHLPCWIGIVPGRTSLSSALYAINSTYKAYTVDHDPPDSGSVMVNIGSNDHSLLSIILSIDDVTPTQTVEQVLLVNTSALGQVTFGDIVSLLGVPNQLEPSPTKSNINPSILYLDNEVRVGFGVTPGFISICGEISMDEEISGIGIGNLPPLRQPFSPKQSWRGFGVCYY